MTVLSKMKKAVGIEEETEIVYYTDTYGLKQWDRENLPILEKGNSLIHTYQSVTGFSVETIEQLKSLCSDPEKFYKAQYFKAHEKDFESLIKLKLDFNSMIAIPENFEQVTKACSKFNGDFESLKLENGKIAFTEKFLEKKDRRYRCAARTPEEKERLKISLDIIAALKAIEPLLTDRKFADVVKFKRYTHGLPYPVRLVGTADAMELSPNNKFVEEAFAGTNFLGIYLPTRAELKKSRLDHMPKLDAPKWVQFHRRLKIGHTQLFTCLESEYEKIRIEGADEKLPGYFTEAGLPWGEYIDPSKARTQAVTQWTRFK